MKCRKSIDIDEFLLDHEKSEKQYKETTSENFSDTRFVCLLCSDSFNNIYMRHYDYLHFLLLAS